MKTTKELEKAIAKIGYYSIEQFEADAKRYIKAIKERRMLCIIDSVSKSGMSRTIKFLAPEVSKEGNYSYQNFWCLFKALGYSEVKNSDYFRINGCGMDMIFHTNYSIIHDFKNLELLTKEECDHLSQQTPTHP